MITITLRCQINESDQHFQIFAPPYSHFFTLFPPYLLDYQIFQPTRLFGTFFSELCTSLTYSFRKFSKNLPSHSFILGLLDLEISLKCLPYSFIGTYLFFLAHESSKTCQGVTIRHQLDPLNTKWLGFVIQSGLALVHFAITCCTRRL